MSPELPNGIERANTRWGEPANKNTCLGAPGSQPVPDMPSSYEPVPQIPENPRKPIDHTDRTKKCRANDDTCLGWRIKGSEFCAGHAGVLIPGGGHQPQ